MPRSSTASLVIEEVMTLPPPISTRTCEVVAPFFTSRTVPLIWLRALRRMMVLTRVLARGHATPVGRSDRVGKRDHHPGVKARAYGASDLDLSPFQPRNESVLAELSIGLCQLGLASGALSTA